jgi:hypothetical protein
MRQNLGASCRLKIPFYLHCLRAHLSILKVFLNEPWIIWAGKLRRSDMELAASASPNHVIFEAKPN